LVFLIRNLNKQILRIIREIYNPELVEKKISLKEKVITFLVLLVCAILFEEILIFIRAILDYLDFPYKLDNKIFDNESKTYYSRLLIFGFYMPILEELAFRLPFRIRINNVIISASLTLTFITNIIVSKLITLTPDTIIQYIAIDLVIFVVYFVIAFFFFSRNKTKWELFLRNHYVLLINLSIALWILLHFNNYYWSGSTNEFFPAILIVCNFFFYGFAFTFLRLKCGISWAILSHIIRNLFILI